MLVEFLHGRFGREKVQAILLSTASTFEDAFRQAVGISQREFFEAARAAPAGKK